MGIRCTSCDRELPDEPAKAAGDATVCPSCGAAPPGRARKAGRLILTLTTVVMIVVAVVLYLQRRPTKGREAIVEGVEITITAPRPTPVRVDGAMIGRTPVVFKVKADRARTIKIEGDGVVKEITLDRDQVVDLGR